MRLPAKSALERHNNNDESYMRRFHFRPWLVSTPLYFMCLYGPTFPLQSVLFKRGPSWMNQEGDSPEENVNAEPSMAKVLQRQSSGAAIQGLNNGSGMTMLTHWRQITRAFSIAKGSAHPVELPLVWVQPKRHLLPSLDLSGKPRHLEHR